MRRIYRELRKGGRETLSLLSLARYARQGVKEEMRRFLDKEKSGKAVPSPFRSSPRVLRSILSDKIGA